MSYRKSLVFEITGTDSNGKNVAVDISMDFSGSKDYHQPELERQSNVRCWLGGGANG